MHTLKTFKYKYFASASINLRNSVPHVNSFLLIGNINLS